MSYCVNPWCEARTNPQDKDKCQSCGTPLKINQRYTIHQSLRENHLHPYTEVFTVLDALTGTHKVLKILKVKHHPKLVQLFEQERDLLFKLKHSGIPKFEDYFELEINHAQSSHLLRGLVMEHIPGETLESWLQHHKKLKDEAQALDWLEQVTTILAYLHRKGFFHRDLKPSNIICRPDGRLVLIDFGTARQYTDTVIAGQQVTQICSYGYTAPEQQQGQAVPPSDFYALGRTWVHLLTGKHPEDTHLDLDHWATETCFPTAPLIHLTQRLLQPQPQERPQTAEEILDALRQLRGLAPEREEENVRDRINQTELHRIPQSRQHFRQWLPLGLLPILIGIGIGIGRLLPWNEPAPLLNNSFAKSFAEVDVPSIPVGRILRYSGSTASASLTCPSSQTADPTGTQGIHAQIQVVHPSFQLNYLMPLDGSAPNSNEGIKMLIEGEVDFALSSRPLTDEDHQDRQGRNFQLKQIEVARYALAIVANPGVGINLPRGLTLEQLDQIFAGEIQNWRQVGGMNQAIQPYVHIAEKYAPYAYVQQAKRKTVAPNTVYVKTTTAGLQKVAQNLGGIYRAPAPLVAGQTSIQTLGIRNTSGAAAVLPYIDFKFNPLAACQTLSRDRPIPAPINTNYLERLQESLYVIYKDDLPGESLAERAGKAYAELLLSQEGQAMLEHLGFQPVR